jgi:hypothetical protein
MRGIAGENIEAATLPTFGDMVGEASVVRADEPAATVMIQNFINGNPLTVETGPLNLEVLNGNGVAGSAGQAADLLGSQGFTIVRVGDADRSDFPSTVVIVRPGDMARAQALVDSLGFGTVESGTVADGIDAVVIVGADFVGP